MASFVNANDVIAAAVEIERRGHKFYKNVAAKSTGAQAKEFFEYMAGEELKHEKIFSLMLGRIGGVDLPADADDAEYLEYVKASLDTHLLFVQENPDLSEPYGLAIQFEKDTIFYFMAMLSLVPESEKKYVKDCIDEEKKHILLLSKKRNTL